jgi:hypothetical protein
MNGKIIYNIMWAICSFGCMAWFIHDGNATSLNLFVFAPLLGLVIVTFIIQTGVKLWIAFHPNEFLDEVRDWWNYKR